MKKTNLLKLFCLLLLSSGLYGFIWSYGLIDQLSEEDDFSNQRIVRKKWVGGAIVACLSVLLMGVFMFGSSKFDNGSMNEQLFLVILFTVAFSIHCCLLNNIIVVNNYLKARKKLRTPNTASLVFFYFFFYFSLIKVQSVINDYIDLKSSNEADQG